MFNMVRSIRLVALGGVAVAAIATQPALAADTAELGVSAAVTDVCNVTTSPVAFGNIDVTTAGNVDATGGFSVTCTSGLAWTAAADAGNGTGASTAARKMMSGANLLNYALYTDSGRTANFVSATGTGSGSAQASTIYGRVPSGQTTVPAGSYADSVTVSLTY
ncbi:MAG: spore coat protein U domain-containing protein [Sphingomonas sp.]|nr:spore coat protein U domain-containing protein [Sphingomonas sp.]